MTKLVPLGPLRDHNYAIGLVPTAEHQHFVKNNCCWPIRYFCGPRLCTQSYAVWTHVLKPVHSYLRCHLTSELLPPLCMRSLSSVRGRSPATVHGFHNMVRSVIPTTTADIIYLVIQCMPSGFFQNEIAYKDKVHWRIVPVRLGTIKWHTPLMGGSRGCLPLFRPDFFNQSELVVETPQRGTLDPHYFLRWGHF